MKNTPAPSVPRKIFPPILDYHYFENRQHYPFQHNADDFALVNALYTHVGALHSIDNAGYLHGVGDEEEVAGPLDAFSLALAQSLLPYFDFLRHVDSSRQLIIPGFLADHAPIYYATYMWNNLIDRVSQV
jgi:hypothetical protein